MTKKRAIIRMIAIDWVCPNNHNPTTPYEKDEVNRLIRFAEDVTLALGKPDIVFQNKSDVVSSPDEQVKIYLDRFIEDYEKGH